MRVQVLPGLPEIRHALAAIPLCTPFGWLTGAPSRACGGAAVTGRLRGGMADDGRPPIGPGRRAMTNGVAIFLSLLILGALALDSYLGTGAALFLGREFVNLIGWMAFWR